MSLQIFLVLACGVFLPSVFAGPMTKSLTENLEITRKEAHELEVENAKLVKQFGEVTHVYEDKIHSMNIEKQNRSAEVKIELEKLKNLNSDVAKQEQELEMVENEIDRYNRRGNKNALGLKWLEDNIANLESRRKNREHTKCFELDSNKPVNGTERHLIEFFENPPTFSSNHTEEPNTDLNSNREPTFDTDDTDDLILLAQALKSAKTKLAKLKAEHNKLSKNLKERNDFWKNIHDGLTKTLNEVQNDLAKAKEKVKEAEDKLEVANSKLKTARQELNSKISEKKVHADRILLVKKSLQEFSKETACYLKIEKELLNSI